MENVKTSLQVVGENARNKKPLSANPHPYLASGKNLTPLKGKIPIRKDWTKKLFSDKEILSHAGNLGWVLGEEDLVVDIDPKNGGEDGFLKLTEDLKAVDPTIELKPTVLTPSGGFHVYLSIPAAHKGRKLRKNLKRYLGVDFLTKGSQCVIAESSTEKGSYAWVGVTKSFEQVPAPDALFQLIDAEIVNKRTAKTLGSSAGSDKDLTAAEVAALLKQIPHPSTFTYDDWVEIGMCVNSWNEGSEGFKLWDDWSKASEKYVQETTLVKWKSFDPSGGKTLGTLIHMAKTTAPDWCANWIYVNSVDKYVNLTNMQECSHLGFNVANTIRVPTGKRGGKSAATKYVNDYGFIDTVDNKLYIPSVKKRIVIRDGVKYLNTFNHEGLPKVAANYTDEGLKAIEIIKRHFSQVIFNSDDEVEFFIQWLAHQVQYTGKLLRWAPLIQGAQGVGKTFIGDLIKTCLGDRNVGLVYPAQLTTGFNAWAINVAVSVFEELSVKGRERHDINGNLKPLLTDRMIKINDKCVRHRLFKNETNHIGFTNEKDALPLENGDRRWWVVFAKVSDMEELERATGETEEVYFDKLIGAVRDHGTEIHKWLAEYEITKEFKAMTRAPMTESKRNVIAHETASIHGLDDIADLIAKGGKYFCKEVISSAHLFKAVEALNLGLVFTDRQKNKLLTKLSYNRISERVKIDDVTMRLWAKDKLNKNQAREILVAHGCVIDEQALTSYGELT